MRYLSVCSGIEAATVAWHPLDWTPVAFSEIEKFPSAVLAHHYPDTPNLGDMTQHEHWPIGPGSVDLLVGGTPCQSFSVAGLRKGLADPRGNLALTYLAIADRLRPKWIVWENVPGVLSSSGGRDFGAFLGALGELGYGFAYRVLDAQFFGVAQRRRRVFLVGHASDWRRAAAVLFERESLRWHPAPSRAKGQGAAATIRTRAPASGGQGTDCEHVVAHCLAARDGSALCAPDIQTYITSINHAVPQWPCDVAPTLNAHFGEKQGLEDQHALGGAGLFVPVYATDGQANAAFANDIALSLTATNEQPYIAHAAVAMVNMQGSKSNAVAQADGPSYTLNAMHGHDVHAVAFHPTQDPISSTEVCHSISSGNGQGCATAAVAIAPTLTAANDPSRSPQSAEVTQQVAAVHAATMAVRRLTPVECERLQGFPDGYTAISWRGKPASECPDGPRYRALGNSMAVPCMRWIGERIAQVDALP